MNMSLGTPEERLAARVLHNANLQPPIDVLALAQDKAVVKEKMFPLIIGELDGLCLDLNRPGRKPEIWLNAKLPHHRKRFTLAHEIGHIVIPWHTGSIVDQLDAEDSSERSDYRDMEAEANRFAAELLMPTSWCADLCHRAEHMADAMISIARLVDVSFQAASFRAARYGPPGYMVAAEVAGVVSWSSKTPLTHGNPPLAGAVIDVIHMPAFDRPRLIENATTRYWWWENLESVLLPDRPIEPWRQILARMLDESDLDDRQVAQQRLNAIIGLAIGRHTKGSGTNVIYKSCLEALQNRATSDADLRKVLNHCEIGSYILGRAYERSEA